MTLQPIEASPAQIAVRIRVGRDGGWRAALLLPEGGLSTEEVATALAAEVLALAGLDVTRIASPSGARVVEHAISSSSRTRAVLTYDFSAFGPADWAHLDGLRSRFEEATVWLLLLTEGELGSLLRHAPNLGSWLGGNVFALALGEEQMGEGEQHVRLAALESRTGLTSAEVVRQAEAGTLPRDPEFAEWLVLLGRSDLLDR